MRFRHGEVYGIEACGGGVSEPSETLVFIEFCEIAHPFCTQFGGNLESSSNIKWLAISIG